MFDLHHWTWKSTPDRQLSAASRSVRPIEWLWAGETKKATPGWSGFKTQAIPITQPNLHHILMWCGNNTLNALHVVGNNSYLRLSWSWMSLATSLMFLLHLAPNPGIFSFPITRPALRGRFFIVKTLQVVCHQQRSHSCEPHRHA